MNHDPIIILYFLLVIIIYALIKLVKKYQESKQKIINLTDIKNFMRDNASVVERTDSGALLLKDLYILEYVRVKDHNTFEETIIFSQKWLEDEDPSEGVEIIFQYINGELVCSQINGHPLNTENHPGDYIAAHKLLELGQQAWLGKFKASQY